MINEKFCKNVSSRPTGLFSRFCWNDSPLFTTAAQLFFQSLLSHLLCSRLERFSTANNFSNLWCSKLQHVSTYAFCCWENIVTQKGNCCSPNNLWKSPKSPSPVFQPLYSMEFLIVFKQPFRCIVYVRNEFWTPF